MSNEITLRLKMEIIPSIAILYNNEYRYSQAKIYGDILRYYKSGAVLKHVSNKQVEISLSVKIGSQGELIKRDGRRYCVPFAATLESISFKDNTYTDFPTEIGFDLIAFETCEINRETGDIVIIGQIDPKLDMLTFKIGYPLGQPELVS